jgi:hypothetical protein
MDYPSRKLTVAQSLYVAHFAGRTPVKTASPILDYLLLCTLRELRLLHAQFSSPIITCLRKRGMSVALMTSVTAVVSQRAQATW